MTKIIITLLNSPLLQLVLRLMKLLLQVDDISGDIDVDGHTNLDNVSISGVTTASQGLRVPHGSATQIIFQLVVLLRIWGTGHNS